MIMKACFNIINTGGSVYNHDNDLLFPFDLTSPILAFGLAYIEYRCFNGMMLRVKKSSIACLEKYLCFLCKSRSTFICVDYCEDSLFKPDGRHYEHEEK